MLDNDADVVWVSVGLTKNLGNYESLKRDAGGKRTVKPGEDKNQVWNDLWDEVEKQLEERLKK